jgi:hypothetical protein
MARLADFNWLGTRPASPPKPAKRNTTGRHIYTCKGGCGKTVSARHHGDAWCSACLAALPQQEYARPAADDVDLAEIPF